MVDRPILDQRAFTNMLRSLFNIDAYQLPELTSAGQTAFLHDPVRCFIAAADDQQAAIWREIVKRQPSPNIRGAGWRDDCPRCVGSKFTCDAHYMPAPSYAGIALSDHAQSSGIAGWHPGDDA